MEYIWYNPDKLSQDYFTAMSSEHICWPYTG